MNLDPIQAVIRCQLIFHIPVFAHYSGHLSVCGRPSIVHELVGSGQHWAAPSLLQYTDQPGVADGNVIYMQI